MNKFSEYRNDGSIKIYLAAPFFNEEQKERIEFVENLLDRLKFDVFSPRRASTLKSGSPLSEMEKTFNENIKHIDSCDFVLAILDTEDGCKYSDSGTVFEFGYAYSKNKPVLCFNETRDKGANLMLAMSGKLPYITKTNELASVLNEATVNRIIMLHSSRSKSKPRANLELVLKNIIHDGIDYIIKASKYYQEEIE